MGQKVTPATNLCNSKLIQSLSFRRLRGRGAQVLHIILSRDLAILLDLLKISKILTADDVVTAHATNWEDHFERYT